MKKRLAAVFASAIFCIGASLGALGADAAPAAGVRSISDIKIVAYGDSITAAGKWESFLRTATGANTVNMGVGGDSTHTALPRFKNVLAAKPEIVFIAFGTNDAAIDMDKYTPLEKYRELLGKYIDECRAAGAQVIVMTPPPVDDVKYLTRHDEEPFKPYGGPNGLVAIYAAAAREVAAERKVLCCDINAAFSAKPNYASLLSDGVHPTDAGYKLYAETVRKSLSLLLLGDIDLDMKLTANDYLYAKRAVLGTADLPADALARADADGNGKVDANDYLYIKRAVLGTYDLKKGN